MGAGISIWEAWEKKRATRLEILERGAKSHDGQREEDVQDRTTDQASDGREKSRGRSKGKGRAVLPVDESTQASTMTGAGLPRQNEEGSQQAEARPDVDAVVVFSCQHIYHERCLAGQIGDPSGGRNANVAGDWQEKQDYRCLVCT